MCGREREKDGDGRHLTFKMNLSGQQPSEMEIIINKEIDIPECIKSPAGKQIFLLLLLCLRFLWILLDEILIEETNLLEELRDQKKKREGLLLRPAFNFFHFKGALDFYDFLKSLFFCYSRSFNCYTKNFTTPKKVLHKCGQMKK